MNQIDIELWSASKAGEGEGCLAKSGAFRIVCTSCGADFSGRFVPFCEHCQGHTDSVYDLARVGFEDSTNPYRRFADLLPVHDRSLLPRQQDYTSTIHATRLGKQLKLPWLYLKNESELPTRSTKDRMAAVSLAYLYECGVREFCTSSTGNSSTSYAHAIERFPDLKMYLFTASDFRHRVQFTPAANIVHYVLDGASFVEAFEYAGRFARRNGFVSERGFFNVGRREGLKLAFFESTEQVERPVDWYVQAVSSAMGVYGTYKGAQELRSLGRIERLPRLLCVQQESCAPMVRAFERGAKQMPSELVVSEPKGIAEAILRGDPTRVYPIMRSMVLDSDGTFTSVGEEEIRNARSLVEKTEGISPCFSASTAMAGLIRCARAGLIAPNDTILVNLTGGDRNPSVDDAGDNDARWLVRSHKGWIPADRAADEGLVHDG